MEVETDLNSITDEDQLRKMWLEAEDFNRKKEIRTHLYKLREARLRGFYDDINTTSSSTTMKTTTSRGNIRDDTDSDLSRSPVNLSNITKNKFPFKSHGDSIIDHTYQSYKTKEIRDSESPTHEINTDYSNNKQHVPDTMSDKSGWNIQTSSEVSPDGKMHKNELYATTEGYKQLDDGHTQFSGVNTEKSTVAVENEDDKTIERAENESKIKLHEKKVTGDLENQRTETETTEVFSTSSKTFTSTSKPTINDDAFENITSNKNIKCQNYENTLEKVESSAETSQMKKSKEILKLDKSSPEYQKYVDYLASQSGQILSETSEYIKPNVKLISTKKQLEDGTVVTTRRYETEEYETGTIDTKSSTKVETDKEIKKSIKMGKEDLKQPVKQVQEEKNFTYEKNVDSAHNAFASSLRNQSQTPSPTASRRSSTRSNISQISPSRSSFRRRPSDEESNATFSRKNSTRSSFSSDKKEEISEIRKSSITKKITSKTDESTDGAVYSRSNSAKLRKMSKDDIKDKEIYKRKDSQPKSSVQKRYFNDDKERKNSAAKVLTTTKNVESKETTTRYGRKSSDSLLKKDSFHRSPSPENLRKQKENPLNLRGKPCDSKCRSPSPEIVSKPTKKHTEHRSTNGTTTIKKVDESMTSEFSITKTKKNPLPEKDRRSPSPTNRKVSDFRQDNESTGYLVETRQTNKAPKDYPEGPEKYPRKYSGDKGEFNDNIETVEFRPSPGITKPSDFRKLSNSSTTTVNIKESSSTERTSKYTRSTENEGPEISLNKLKKTVGPFSPEVEEEEKNFQNSKRTDTFIKEEQAKEEKDRKPYSSAIDSDYSTRRKSSSPDIPLHEAKKNLTERRDSLKKNSDSRKSSVVSTSPRRRSSGNIDLDVDEKSRPSRKLKSVLKRSETYEERCRLILGMDNEQPSEKPDGSSISKENNDVPANDEFIIDWNATENDNSSKTQISSKRIKVPITERKDSAPIHATPKSNSSIYRSTSENVISKLEKKKSQEVLLESNRLPDVIQEPEDDNRKNMKGKSIEVPILNEETNEYMKSFHIEELDETDEIPDRVGNTPSPIISSPQYPPQDDNNDDKYIDDDNCLSVNEKLSKFLSMEKQNQNQLNVPGKEFKSNKLNKKKYWENDAEDEVVIIEKENVSNVKKQFENFDVNKKVDDKAKVNSDISKGIVSSRKDIFEVANSSIDSNILRERDNFLDEGKSKVSQLRHSYMNHTISSMEHRRDSLELAKTSYGQKIKGIEEPYEPKPSTAVKFETPPKVPPKSAPQTRKESRELLIPQSVDVLDSRKLEDVSVRRSSVEIEEYVPTKFGVELKRKNSQPKQRKQSNPDVPHIEEIFDLDLLEEMLKNATGYEQRRRIRAQIRIVKKNIEDRKVNGSSPSRKVKSVTSTSTTTKKVSSSGDRGQEGFVKTSTVTTIKKQTGDKAEENTITSSTTKRLSDNQETKAITTKKRPNEPSPAIKQTTSDSPIWVRKNILRKVDSNERPVKTYKTTKTEVGPTKTVKTTTTTTTTSDGGEQKHTEVDVITSSYGIGPTDDDGKPLFGIRALKYKKSSEDNNSNNRSNCKSFINESSNELTSINDVITRMQNADKVQEDGDTEKDREARALLNKFIGANILMSSIETTTGSVPGGPNKGNKNQINCSTTTRTTKASTTISGDNQTSVVATADDNKLLEDEEPLEVINFLRQIMAGREDVAKPSGCQEDEHDSTKKDAVKRVTTSSSSSETSKTTTTTTAAKKPISALNKFKQLEKQNSLQSPKSPISPQAVGGAGTPPQSPIFKFTDPALNARALTFKEQLLQWCQAKTKEYENVQITNFSTSWNDGLAFCALIHHFLPDSFDYSKLDSKHRRQNFELAFRVADEKAGIAPLLDVEDMVVMKKPDWKCVFTYVQSIFRRFRNCQ